VRVSDLLDLDMTTVLRTIHKLVPFAGYARCHVGLCSASLQAVGMARTAIAAGKIDAAIVGGVSGRVTPSNVSRLEGIGAVCMDPLLEGPRRSRPYDARRSGFVPAEGAVLFLLEREDAVLRRGGRPYLRVMGYGSSLCAEHIIQPHSTSLEMRLSMGRALRSSGVPLDAITSVNSHGTSTKLNDLHESRAIRAIFEGHRVPHVAATKSNHGHLIAAAGAMEILGIIGSFEHDYLPAIRNLEEDDGSIDVPLLRARVEGPVRNVLKNSFGMGGLAASAVLQNPRYAN
jgi:3-oxoacyl-[acyl-carrier-protein] synthase II